MHAVIRTGGKQYRIKAGDEFNVEKISGADKGDEIVFDQILAVGDGDGIQVGAPLVSGASVKANVVTTGRDRKVIIFKKNRRKGYQLKRGHRQPFTRVRITEINA